VSTSYPSSSRGQPALEQAAQDAIGAVRGQPRHHVPAGYEPEPVSAEEKAEAERLAAEDARICKYCIGVHRYPTTIACPRIAEAELDGDANIRKVRFFEGKAWAKGRVALYEDLSEEASDD
jgi:hypothetical protein